MAWAPYCSAAPSIGSASRSGCRRCAAVVHHGGVGTIAEAFAAGVPQLILPIAFDQKDNAIRVKRLGAGDWVRAGRATGPRVAERLRGILTTQVKARCEEIARRFD